MPDIALLGHTVRSWTVDRTTVPQEKLDLTTKGRVSLFPWRGQFSPELIEYLLSRFAGRDTVVLDPFAGSGTTLIEASRQGLPVFGAEVNPAAVQLSRLAEFSCLSDADRHQAIFSAHRHLLSLVKEEKLNSSSIRPVLRQALSDSRQVHDLIVAAVMLAMGNGDALDTTALQKSFNRVCSTITKLPIGSARTRMFAADARTLPLEDSSVNLVVTSPPYINVFNYHQNYRKAMELMGWRPLTVAPSEIGSNRKHRANRLLTVIQYSLDIAQTFIELRRVLAPNGLAIVTIGRQSRVRGLAFNNAEILATIGSGAGFELSSWHERKFINRFGEPIYEDLLVFKKNDGPSHEAVEVGRHVGVSALAQSLGSCSEEVENDLKQAIEQADQIKPSPIFKQNNVVQYD